MISFALSFAIVMLLIRVVLFIALSATYEMPYDLSEYASLKYWIDEITIWVAFICIILIGLGT